METIYIHVNLKEQREKKDKDALDLEPQNHGLLPNVELKSVGPFRSIHFEHLDSELTEYSIIGEEPELITQ